MEICVDASLAVKVVVTEWDSDKADALFDQWANEGKQLIAPVFFEVETDSILRQKAAVRKELTPEQAGAAFGKLRALPIQQVSEPAQRQRAWEIATDVFRKRSTIWKPISVSRRPPMTPMRYGSRPFP